MNLGTISSRYARALFSLAMEKKEETRVYDDMKMLKESFLLFPELKETLQNPIVSVADKEKLLINAGGIEVCDLYKRFIRVVLNHKRESCLPFMTYIYIYLYRKEKKITQHCWIRVFFVCKYTFDTFQINIQNIILNFWM